MEPVNEIASQDEESLRAQLALAREGLDGLARDLGAVDAELDSMRVEREQYRLLSEACGALEQLGAQGAGALFWGESGDVRTSEEHLLRARARIDEFEVRLDAIEGRRQGILAEIEKAETGTEYIEDDLYELRRIEDEKKREWIVEREGATIPFRLSVMPWTRGGEDDQRFRKSLAAALLASLFLGLVLPMIDIPLPERWQAEEVPDRFTRLVREERPAPPPPPPPPEQQLAERELEKPEPVVTPETKPKQKQKPKPKEKAASKGILAFREKFSSLADAKPAAKLGAQARIQSSKGAAAGRTQRSLVATQASSSGGIDVAALSRDVGGGGEGEITGVEVARATSSIGDLVGEARPLSEGPGLARTDEEIQIVFDRHKAALYRLYNRELRRDPTLRGQMVLRITIEPDGTVSLCELDSSDMEAPKLSSQVLARVKTFGFGAKEVPAITILYPIDFLPAT